jgi:hypothetical protein
MVKRIFFLILVAATLAFMSTAYSETGNKTVTLQNGEVVCDLNGEWATLFEHYGSMEWVGNIKGTLMIEQQSNTFVAKTTKDGAWSKKGTEKIKGELTKGGIKDARYSRPDLGWIDAKCEMSKNCDRIVCDDGQGVKTTLERK